MARTLRAVEMLLNPQESSDALKWEDLKQQLSLEALKIPKTDVYEEGYSLHNKAALEVKLANLEEQDVVVTILGGTDIKDSELGDRLSRFVTSFILELKRDAEKMAIVAGGLEVGMLESMGQARLLSKFSGLGDIHTIGAVPQTTVNYPGSKTVKREIQNKAGDKMYARSAEDLCEFLLAASTLARLPDDWYRASEFVTKAAETIKSKEKIVLVGNGGKFTLHELLQKIVYRNEGEKIVLLKGSGRVTDSIIDLLENGKHLPEDQDYGAVLEREGMTETDLREKLKDAIIFSLPQLGDTPQWKSSLESLKSIVQKKNN